MILDKVSAEKFHVLEDVRRGLRNPSSVFSTMKRQCAEGERKVKSPWTINALSWVLPFHGDINQVYR